MLLVEVVFSDQAHQRQAPVHLFQVHHLVLLLAIRVKHLQLNDGARLIVELTICTGLLVAIDAGYVYKNVNEFRADLVLLNVHWGLVCGDVDFGDHIE